MRRKILQDHANVFCQMLVGWRMGGDLERLHALGSGHLSIDVLTGACTHNEGVVSELHVALELNAWFLERLAQHSIPVQAISHASVDADLSVSEEPRQRGTCALLAWECQSIIRTDDASYVGQLSEEHKWIRNG